MIKILKKNLFFVINLYTKIGTYNGQLRMAVDFHNRPYTESTRLKILKKQIERQIQSQIGRLFLQ